MKKSDEAFYFLVVGAVVLVLPLILLLSMNLWILLVALGIEGFGAWLAFIVSDKLREWEWRQHS